MKNRWDRAFGVEMLGCLGQNTGGLAYKILKEKRIMPIITLKIIVLKDRYCKVPLNWVRILLLDWRTRY